MLKVLNMNNISKRFFIIWQSQYKTFCNGLYISIKPKITILIFSNLWVPANFIPSLVNFVYLVKIHPQFNVLFARTKPLICRQFCCFISKTLLKTLYLPTYCIKWKKKMFWWFIDNIGRFKIPVYEQNMKL